MADVIIDNSNLYDIADSIRAKLGVQTTYKPSQMADAIDSISGGGITPTGEIEITANGTYDVTQYASAEVDVPQSGITPIGTISITQNGTTDVTNYASASVSVPNSYSASDEGKVVSNGTLVSQTSDTVTENGTIDTTLINSLIVAVSGGGSTCQMASGVVTPSADDNSIYVDVDFEPTHAMIFADYANWSYTSWTQWGNVIFDTSYEKYLSLSARLLNGTFGYNAAARDISLISYSDGKFKFHDNGYKFKAGTTYHWMCWR